MPKMKSRNTQLKSALGAMAPKERVQEVLNIPQEDTVNRQGYTAYSLTDELRLISMLNTLKLEPQFYRSENQTMKELRDLIERIGSKDPYFVAQAIVYSRCIGEGMRSINHLGAALLAPFASGNDWAKRFYGRFDRKKQQGGCIYRADDMSEIKDVFAALNSTTLSAAMKTGFRSVLESLDAYQLAKYAKTTRDIANLVHPNPEKSKATVVLEGEDVVDYNTAKGILTRVPILPKEVKVLDAILAGITVSADTWEVANSEAGQEVAKAVKEGKISVEEGKKVLAEAKNQNFLDLLKEGKLGILAALRNIRQMMNEPKTEVIDLLCALVSDPEKLRKGLIMPYQIDIAYEILRNEFSRYDKYNQVCSALLKGYETSIPNLAVALPGKTCVMVDCSGSMRSYCTIPSNRGTSIQATALEKAGLVAATIAKATGADIIRFTTSAHKFEYNRNLNVFELGRQIANTASGGTSIACAWDLIRSLRLQYDRVIILSDNECNSRGWSGNWTSTAYKQYVHDVCSPYVYCVDFCAYGTTPLKGDKVNYYFGYGYAMFDDIASNEFNPMQHIDKVRKVVI